MGIYEIKPKAGCCSAQEKQKQHNEKLPYITCKGKRVMSLTIPTCLFLYKTVLYAMPFTVLFCFAVSTPRKPK